MDFEALQELALQVSGERTVDLVLQRIVDGLVRQPAVALARVWVIRPGDLCDTCRMRPSCADQSACLHLAASAGASLAGEQWSRTDGSVRRVPIGHLKVGSVAANRTGLLLDQLTFEQWLRPEWVRQEGIQSFAAHPLVFQGETLGVLAVFRRAPIGEQEFRWLLIFANQAASAVANARAFSELVQAEARIRQDERELRLLTDAIPQAVAAILPDGHVFYVNKAGLHYLGRSLAELTSSRDQLGEVYFPDDLERSRTTIGEAMSRGTPCELEARLRRHDGEYRWHLVRYEPLRDEQGQIIRWYGTATDIHERRQIEDRVRSENLALREEIDQISMFEEIVGASSALRGVLKHVAKVAPTDSTVLILGETGTGKELVARAIHKRSRRASNPFVSVNCAAIPAALLASELFGHEKGAFTGAIQRRVGRFEVAEGGTIFLDEIGELPVDTQVSLLRVLQEREFERLGGARPIRANVRIISATNRDISGAVAGGAFRSDLFYRLNVFPIDIPPLRERREDIPMLVQYFVSRFSRNVGKRCQGISSASMKLLQAYTWPGNIRELQNVLERAVIVAENETVSIDATWLQTRASEQETQPVPLTDQLTGREKALIEAALLETNGKVAGPAGAAARLKMASTTLESRIRALGIDKHRFKRV